MTFSREFRYDAARQRYLNRELDPVALMSDRIVSLSETWSDYDGDSIYGDFTVDSGTVTNERSFEPGIARCGAPGDASATEYYHANHLGTARLLSVETPSSGVSERVRWAPGSGQCESGLGASSGYPFSRARRCAISPRTLLDQSHAIGGPGGAFHVSLDEARLDLAVQLDHLAGMVVLAEVETGVFDLPLRHRVYDSPLQIL